MNTKETMVRGVTVLSASEMPQENISVGNGQNYLLQGDSSDWLKKLPDNCIDAVVCDPPYGISFMASRWDYDVPSTELWAECLRVLKPGGYLLAFAGTRTQHRMAVRIEDAGFEIRDMIAWVYGSGFPKSLNIGKAVDKLQGNERESVDDPEAGRRNKTVSKFADTYGDIKDKTDFVTKGTSEWEGWGTALKPALEPISVCRKPLEKGLTVAENVLKWGTGGIDIDGSRVGTGEDKGMWPITNREIKGNGVGENQIDARETDLSVGRWPANLIHDGSDEVVGLFPDAEEKSASRFFYVAKASKAERNRGCEELEERERKAYSGAVTSDPRMTHEQNRLPTKNNHPTVKPIALMEYLVKLVSRENAVVLDPFLGSGTTAIACKNTNRQYIGIERDPEYVKIAEARIKTVENVPEPTNQGVN